MVKIQSSAGRRAQVINMMGRLVGGALFIVFIAVIASSLAGPAIGDVFSNISSSVVTAPGSSGSGNTHTASIAPQVPSRVIIQEGQITLIVEDTHATLEAIRAIVGEMATEGAFIVTSEERVDVESQVSIASMAIRVPAARFDEVMDRLAALAVRLEEQRETAEDITEEYVDLQGRLASMEAARDRLRHFMAEAETVEELLRVEPKLAEREAEIESLRGRLKYLTESAQLSQVEIKLRPSVLSKQVAALWQPGETARSAYAGLVKSLQAAVDILIYFGIGLLPWLVVVGLVVYGIWRVERRYHAPRPVGETVQPPSERRLE